MKTTSLLPIIASLAISVNALDETTSPWVAPSSTDRRSPCPGLNTLANHGILPHDGLGIDLASVIAAMKTGYNMDQDAAVLVGTVALETSTTGNASTFNLDDLNTHGIIEHDGSLSRADIYSGDNHSFNKTVWAETTAGFTDETITVSLSHVFVQILDFINQLSTDPNCCCSTQSAINKRRGGEPLVQYDL